MFFEKNPSTSFVTPREIPVIEFPMIIPPIGITYLGSYHGERFTTTSIKYARLAVVPQTIEKAIIFLNLEDSGVFTLLKIFFTAKVSIITRTKSV